MNETSAAKIVHLEELNQENLNEIKHLLKNQEGLENNLTEAQEQVRQLQVSLKRFGLP